VPKVVEINVSGDDRERALAELRNLPGVLGLRVQPGISTQPPGDVITVQITNSNLPELMRTLDGWGLGSSTELSATISEPSALVSPQATGAAFSDTSESTWEEMGLFIAREGNMTPNALALMAIAGVIAAVGITTNALHYVIGAMVIAPGFAPITRISLGLVGGGIRWQRGVKDTLAGYGVLALAGFVTALVLAALGRNPPQGVDSYLPSGALYSYWTDISAPSVLVTLVASLAGGILTATRRSVLTAGLMIALALIPAATLVGMSLATGQFAAAGTAALRWLIDVGIVFAGTGAIFWLKQQSVHRRRSCC
jgi:hypothetical protein